MAIKREFTTGKEFLNNVNETMGTELNASSTPQMLLNAFKVASEAASYNKTDDNVLETINNSTPSEDLLELENVDNIYVSNYPTKNIYTVGEKFDTTGLVISVRFLDGTTRDLIPNKEYKLGEGPEVLFNLDKYTINYATPIYGKFYYKDKTLGVTSFYDLGWMISISDYDNKQFITNVQQEFMFKNQYVVNEELELNGEVVVRTSTNGVIYADMSQIVDLDAPIVLSETGVQNIQIPIKSDFTDLNGGIVSLENPLNISLSVAVQVDATLQVPTHNFYYLDKLPYKRIYELNSSYNFETDFEGGSIIEYMTDGTTRLTDMGDFDCDTYGKLENLGAKHVNIYTKADEEYVKEYKSNIHEYNIFTVNSLQNDITPNSTYSVNLINNNLSVGDSLTKDDLKVRLNVTVTIQTGFEIYTVVDIDPSTYDLFVTNPLVAGENAYMLQGTYYTQDVIGYDGTIPIQS